MHMFTKLGTDVFSRWQRLVRLQPKTWSERKHTRQLHEYPCLVQLFSALVQGEARILLVFINAGLPSIDVDRSGWFSNSLGQRLAKRRVKNVKAQLYSYSWKNSLHSYLSFLSFFPKWNVYLRMLHLILSQIKMKNSGNRQIADLQAHYAHHDTMDCELVDWLHSGQRSPGSGVEPATLQGLVNN